jgi:hypothetical protein
MTVWQPIETAPNGVLLLYFPTEVAPHGRGHSAMIKVDHFPVCYPRQPSHWAPLPSPPLSQIDGGERA